MRRILVRSTERPRFRLRRATLPAENRLLEPRGQASDAQSIADAAVTLGGGQSVARALPPPQVYGKQLAEDRAEQLLAACEDSTDLVALTRTGASLQTRSGPGLLYLNAAGRRLIGVGPDDDISGVYLADFIDAPSSDVLEHQARPAILSEGRWSGELTAVMSDGRRLPMSVAVTRHAGCAGEPSFLSIVARDLSALVNAQERLIESEAWFRSLVQNSSEVVVVWDSELLVKYASLSVERILGHQVEGLLGRRLDEHELGAAVGDLAHPEDAEEVRVWFRELLDGQSVSPLVHRLRHADGSWRIFESVGTALLDDPVVQGIVVNSRDITDSQAAKEARARSENVLWGIVHGAPVAIAVLDSTGLVETWNEAAVKMFGWSEAEVLGRALPSVPEEPDAHREFNALVAAVMRGETIRDLELRRRHRDGHMLDVEASISPLRDAEGRVTRILSIATDVTAKKEAERVRLEAEAEVRASEERFRSLVANLSDAITILGADGMVLYASPSATDMLGYGSGVEVGSDPLAFVHPDDREMVAEVLAQAFTEPGVQGPITLRVLASDGSWRYLEALGNNLLADPIIAGLLVSARDVTRRVVAEEALRQSDERLRALVANLSEVVTVIGADGRLVYTSPAATNLFGFSDGDDSWTDPLSKVHPDDAERVLREFADQRAGDRSSPVEFRIRVADETYRHVSSITADMTDVPGVGGLVVTTRDISDRVRAESLVGAQAQVLTLIAEGAPLGETLATMCEVVESQVLGSWCSIMLLDAEAGVLRRAAGPNVPPVMREVTEVPVGPESVACGRAAFCNELVVVPDIMTDPRHEPVRGLAGEAGIRAIWSMPVLASNGDAVLGTFAVYFGEVGGPSSRDCEVVEMIARLVAIALERKKAEERLAYDAQHDHLTGLPNRALFVEFLTLAQARARRRGTGVAVLFLDLDRFKNVNDSLGHDAGDALLVKLGDRLRAVLRPGDTVARFGGDEFTVLCDDLTIEDPRAEVTEVASRLLEVIERPIEIHGEEVYLSASIGIAIAGPGDRSDELLRDADAAMYRAKELGKGRWEVFDEKMRSHLLRQLETENALHHALKNDELRLHFQPIVDIVSGSWIGAEALVRWQHPVRGLIGPVEFIGLAEETGLIGQVGEWVLDQACAAINRWKVELGLTSQFTVSVNLSARQVARGDLLARVAGALERTGASAEMLCLEITESVLMQVASVETLRELKALGVRISIDDFGTGYSSLGYLKRFPVDVVKVDRSFVDGLGADPEDSAIVAAVVSLGQALGLRVVAEGVETDSQLGELARLGCDYAQGFLFSVAVPEADFESGLRSRGGRWRSAI
ncbi:MAG: EAL domain-containing protein [Actinobacteria bacterium]|nr:EAL domain-containing protein [Actinomycetota bacterium]